MYYKYARAKTTTTKPARGCLNVISSEKVMDIQALVQALGNTLDPSLGKQAEASLEEVRKL